MESQRPSPSHAPAASGPLPLPRRGEGLETRALPLLLTVLFTAFWTALAWSDLAALRLPDPDDMVRLASIRDWIDGQAFGDPVQQRLGPLGGTALHWSRLPELVPAFIIGLLSPVMGATRAELAAVIFWPELLLFAHLLLIGAIARRLGGEAAISMALALALLAYPAITLFLPGRIDHHALQIVLVEALVLALIGGRALLAGLAAAASLVIGVETAPAIAAAMLWLAVAWVQDRRPVAGFGAGLLIASVAAFALLRPSPWAADRCDGFTPPLLAMLLMAGGSWLVLAGLSPRLPDRRWRGATAIVLAALVLAAGWIVAPACFGSPYGAADPVLATAWPAQVGELGGALGQTPGLLVAYLGLGIVAALASLWLWRRDRTGAHALLAAVICAAVLASLVQLRGIWIAAALAAPILAQLIRATSGRGAAWRAGATLASMGLLWQAVGQGSLRQGTAAEPGCTDRQTLSALDRLETGSFAAPTDLSAYLIGSTQHRSLGGPYHRNAQGNRALAELFRAPPGVASYQAALWGVQYVALCPSKTGGLPPALRQPGGLADHLLAGATPDWLDPVPLIGSDLLVWRVQPIAAPRIRP